MLKQKRSGYESKWYIIQLVQRGNCRLRNHKNDGNKHCSLSICMGFRKCNQNDWHADYRMESKQIARDIKSVDKENEDLTTELARISSFQVKTGVSFISVVKERFRATDWNIWTQTSWLGML